MNASLALVPQSREAVPVVEQEKEWLSWLGERLDPAWRPGEWQADRLLFEGDPANDWTLIWQCRVAVCPTLVRVNGGRCTSCARDARETQMSREEFDATHQPSRAKRLVGSPEQPRCLVVGAAGHCEREAQSKGMCNAHEVAFRRWARKMPDLTVADWQRESAPKPLPHRGFCIVIGCNREQVSHQLCQAHGSRRQGPPDSTPAVAPVLRNHQFWLGGLSPIVRTEILLALQDRERAGNRLDPTAVRLVVQHLADAETLCGLDISAIDFGGVRNSKAGRSLLGAMQRITENAHRQFSGDDPSLDDVWDAAAMGLWAASHRRYDTVSGTIDFTTVRQKWLREVLKEWARSVRPDVQSLRINLKAFTIAAEALTRRPGGGETPSRLTGADMTAIVQAIKQARKDDGSLYAASSLSGFLGGWFSVLDFARSSGLLDDLPGSFSRARHHRVALIDPNEEQAGRALPDYVVRQLDANLHLLVGSNRGWSAETSKRFYQTAYAVLRDTGRRLGEVVTLKAGCIELADGNPELVYDNRKAGRHGRRLPITRELADLILEWEECRAALPLGRIARPWIFPSSMHLARGSGHIRGDSLAAVLRDWVRSIPQLESEVIGPDGMPLPFDRSLITAHAFRHTYAQRHADAGVPVDVLRDLMDHRSVDTTMGYYQVTLKRKREAVQAMAPLAVDRFGNPAPFPTDRYEIGSVAVPFGNCTEPSNVKAGGGSCPIRFQCSGCSFYRPDPSYLPAIEDHVRSLKSDRETADAIGAAPFVLDNLTAQIDSFREAAATMRGQLASLDEGERQEIEEASRTLRKARATSAHQLLPLTVINQREERP